jgi:hypothetical protein
MADKNTVEKKATETKSSGNESTKWTKRDPDLAQVHTQKQEKGKK